MNHIKEAEKLEKEAKRLEEKAAELDRKIGIDTRLAVIVDRSGSMQRIKTDMEGAFRAYMEEQKKQKGELRVTLCQFDTEYEVLYRDRSVHELPEFSLQPRGGTALLDAIGQTIGDMDAEYEGLTVVLIITDGMENASREWDHERVKTLISARESGSDWQFVYIGAHADAIQVGTGLGIQLGNVIQSGIGGQCVNRVVRGTSQKMAAYRGSGLKADMLYSVEDRAEAMDES